jgi:hypothetical protein
MAATARREIDVERVRALAAASAGRIGVVTLPMAGRPRFVLDLGYTTAGSSAYPRERQASSRITIDLAPRHPFQPPLTTVLTPIFHPHVFGSGVVCIGARWLPGEGMDLFVRRVVRLLAFDPLLMNPHSIANAAANTWYRSSLQRHPQAFPTDAAAIAWHTGAESASGRVIRPCPHCGASLRLPAGRSGAVQCPRCAGDFELST